MTLPLVATVLRHPSVYILAQRAVGAQKVRTLCIEALAPAEGQRILDIGCGPAYYVSRLPRCEYHGFDTDSTYIAYARRHFGDRGTFYDEPYDERHRAALPLFDRALLMGLLHHLDDDACHALLDLVAGSLAPGGRAATLDTVLFEEQTRFSRALAGHDRGAFVRSPEAFLKLGRAHFDVLEHRILGGTWPIPSAHFLMVLSTPAPDTPTI
jgi:SAM-dependent methyltransferase